MSKTFKIALKISNFLFFKKTYVLFKSYTDLILILLRKIKEIDVDSKKSRIKEANRSKSKDVAI